MKVTGKVFKFGDNIDTDVIIPARYLNTSDPKELASHCMEDVDKSFAQAVKPGDVIVGGKNFGCGSSREHAPLAIKTAGVSCVVAKSFARIFYRNAINIGLPLVECEAAADDAQSGATVTIDFENGTVHNILLDKCYSYPPYPPFIEGIIEAGGLVGYLRVKNGEA